MKYIALAVVSNQIQSLGAQVNQLSNSLAVVRNSLATSQALERQKERQEQVLENRLQQKLREGKESAVEKKIQQKFLSCTKTWCKVANKSCDYLDSSKDYSLGG